MLLASDSSPTKARGWPKWPCIGMLPVFQVCSEIPTQPPSLTVSSPTKLNFFFFIEYSPKLTQTFENTLQDIAKSFVSTSSLTRNPQVPHGPSRSGARTSASVTSPSRGATPGLRQQPELCLLSLSTRWCSGGPSPPLQRPRRLGGLASH